MKFALVIKELGGSKDGVKRSLIARQVRLAESTPSFFQRLSASKVFGVIEGWGEYRLTETGRNYFYPQSDQAKIEALLTMLSTPRAFAFLVKRFGGDKLPSSEIMGNILHQELGVSDSWKDRVAQIFIRSAHFAGIIDSDGFLKYDSEMHKSQSTVGEIPVEITVNEPPTKATFLATDAPARGATATAGKDVWQFDHIRLETPRGMSRNLWEKLSAYVQILKPEDESPLE